MTEPTAGLTSFVGDGREDPAPDQLGEASPTCLTSTLAVSTILLITRCRLRWEPGRGHSEAGQRSAQRQAPGWCPVFVCAQMGRGDTQMSDQNGYVQFVSDDDGYLSWLAANPTGFVVNSHRVPVPEYLVLHRASCRSINTGARNNWTTTGYIKTCSPSVAPLEAWAGQVASGRLKPCGACKPHLGLETIPSDL